MTCYIYEWAVTQTHPEKQYHFRYKFRKFEPTYNIMHDVDNNIFPTYHATTAVI